MICLQSRRSRVLRVEGVDRSEPSALIVGSLSKQIQQVSGFVDRCPGFGLLNGAQELIVENNI
jgi:hypothetical protein